MLDTLKEHIQEFAADTLLKHVLPSIIMAQLGDLSRHLRWVDTGRPLLSDKAIQGLTALIILGVNYAIHLWFFLKRRAAAARPQA